MDYRLDEIDRLTLYYLGSDARNTTATEIAEQVNVSAATVRNRINQLEQHGVVRGYPAHIDYERGEGLLTGLYVCSVRVSERDQLARDVLGISGVVNVRDVMSGDDGLHVKAVGEDTTSLQRIASEIENLGATIEDESLVKAEYYQPYQPYGPADATSAQPATNVLSLVGDAQVVDLTVTEDAPVAGKTLAEAKEQGLLGDDVLVVAIERADDVVSANGRTEIQPGDLVSVFSPDGVGDATLNGFGGAEAKRR
ncbi:Lrp/AsnC family transcriptional regulator [Halobacterium yunchengense]|uniref:Lrp/AsnC family transcriptional regulator n=1 Tax=Halobacterium yunchengense TaxID=3108497 RepID=UPI003008D874